MRHGNKGKKLNRTSSHLKAMLMNISNSLIMHEQIKTTLPKAKTLRPFLEKLVTIAKANNLHARRQLLSVLHDHLAVEKLLSTLASRYATRPGGYLRIIKAGNRYGDNAPMAIIEFVERDVNARGQNYYSSDIAEVITKV